MKCTRFSIESLRNEEWFQFLTEFKILTEQYEAEALNITSLFNIFLSLYADADTSLEVIRKSATTEQLAEVDNKRDTLFRGFADAVKSLRNHFEPEKQQAAKRLQIIFNHYGNIARKLYDEETAAIYNFIQDLRTTGSSDVTTLNLTDWITQLEIENKNFEQLMQNRYVETSSKTELRIYDVRIDTTKSYRNILDQLDALMLINGEEKYAPYVKELNTRIDRFTNIIAQRKGRLAKAKTQK